MKIGNVAMGFGLVLGLFSLLTSENTTIYCPPTSDGGTDGDVYRLPFEPSDCEELGKIDISKIGNGSAPYEKPPRQPHKIRGNGSEVYPEPPDIESACKGNDCPAYDPPLSWKGGNDSDVITPPWGKTKTCLETAYQTFFGTEYQVHRTTEVTYNVYNTQMFGELTCWLQAPGECQANDNTSAWQYRYDPIEDAPIYHINLNRLGGNSAPSFNLPIHHLSTETVHKF